MILAERAARVAAETRLVVVRAEAAKALADLSNTEALISKAAQGAFGGIVGEADPPIIDEASEPIPAAQHIIDRSSDRGRVREASALLAQPRFQLRHKRGALFFAHPQTFFGALAIDAAFNIEQGINALDCFERDWRDRRCFLAAPGIGRDIRQLEELPAGMRPTQ